MFNAHAVFKAYDHKTGFGFLKRDPSSIAKACFLRASKAS